jgi:dihydropteroate synthase
LLEAAVASEISLVLCPPPTPFGPAAAPSSVAALEARAREFAAGGLPHEAIAIQPRRRGDGSGPVAVLQGIGDAPASGYAVMFTVDDRLAAGLGATPLDRRDTVLASVATAVGRGCRIVATSDVLGTARVCRMVEALLATAGRSGGAER